MDSKDLLTGVKSGFFIALIALPLCLGIAMASSFPPVAGIFTAIVGGMVVSLLGGCKLSIKGPAAGLIVIVLATVTELGGGDMVLGYKRCLAVCLMAAILQIILGLFKVGRFGRLMPPSVIHGMLAAIGVIIIAKQIHILMGSTPYSKTTWALISEIPESIMSVNPELAFIGIITLFLMVSLPLIPYRFMKSIPPALIALLIVIPLGLYWHLDVQHDYTFIDYTFTVGPKGLVDIPASIFSSLVFPDFSILLDLKAYKFVLMLGLIGSIESVLTVIAVDGMCKMKEKSNLDRDLLAIGIGNFICALIGGLPMISEVVRSKANIDSGAKNHWANFFHGLFLLIAISLAAPLIREIPVAALAAMLIVIGIRLASPSMFLKTYKIGVDQLALFLTTLLVTLSTDLLVGVISGVLLKLVMHLARGVKLSSFLKVALNTTQEDAHTTRVMLVGPAIFSNYFSLQKRLNELLSNKKMVILDLSKATLVDHTTLSCLYSFLQELDEKRLEIVGLDKLTRLSNHQLSTHRFA